MTLDQGAGVIPVTGVEFVLLQNDEGVWIGVATTAAIAALADGGGGFDFEGSGSPLSNALDPAVVGVAKTYRDTTNGALYMVILNPSGSILEWVLVGGEISGVLDAHGVILGNGAALVSKSIVGVQVIITDLDAYNDSGNGISWYGDGTDGGQFFRVRVGAPGSPKTLQFHPTLGLVNPLDFDMSSGGDAYFTNNGIILKSPDNTLYRLVVANGGALSTVPV